MRLGHRQAAGQVHHEPACHVGTALAKSERGDELGILVDPGPQVDVANRAAQGSLLGREPGLFLGDERPNLVAFDVTESQAAKLVVHQGFAMRPGGFELAQRAGDVRPHQAASTADAVPFDQEAEDGVALFDAHHVCHSEVAFRFRLR